MPTQTPLRRVNWRLGGRPHPVSRPRRLACSVVMGALFLASCGRFGDEQGQADVRGVGRTFCSALEDFAAYADMELSDETLAAMGRDSQAIVEIIPADAPAEVSTYFAALPEMIELSRVWENPETGGIKEEYVDDFIRLLDATTGDPAAATESYARSTCQDPSGGGLGRLLPGGGEGSLLGSTGGGSSPSAAPAPVVVQELLGDGPSGMYEQVTLDIGAVTATTADPATALGADPVPGGGSSLLVEIDATTEASAGNQFNADHFRLTDPSGATTTARSIIDGNGGEAPLQLRGRDTTRGIVVFATDALVSDLRGHTVSVDRDDRVPTLLPFGPPVATPYPVGLEGGATGALEVRAGPCVDTYETAVTSAAADLDADLGDSSGIVRSPRGQRWIRVVLDVTNVTVQGPSSNDSVCHAFSGNYAGVELRLEADGRAEAPANERSFDQIEPGTTGERVHVFAVPADARELTLVGPGGEPLGRWRVDLPAAPGEA